MSFNQRRALLKALGVRFHQASEYRGECPNRKEVTLPLFRSVLLPLTATEWCDLCQREGPGYVGGCCSQMSYLQDRMDHIFGEKTYIAYDVKIGNGVKINSFVYVCTGVTIEDKVMISAGTLFTNDRFPRAFDSEGSLIKTSDPTEETLDTIVRRGVTIGAGCTIGSGIELGEFCMVGMGSTVTRSILPYQLVYGNPAKPQGFVCACGEPLLRKAKGKAKAGQRLLCAKCKRQYTLHKGNHISFQG